jgi:hypothetical protein
MAHSRFFLGSPRRSIVLDGASCFLVERTIRQGSVEVTPLETGTCASYPATDFGMAIALNHRSTS